MVLRIWWWIRAEITWLDQFVKNWMLRCIFIGGHSLIVVAACFTFVWASARQHTYSSIKEIPKRYVGVVLGCSKKAGSHENPDFLERVNAAAQLYQAEKVQYIVVSGDGVQGSTETQDLKEALIAKGVPASHIYPDYAGFHTLDSVLRARDVYGYSDFTLISQGFHNERALYIAKRNGIEDAIAFNAPGASTTSTVKMFIREVFARIAAVVEVELFHSKPRYLGARVTIGPTTPPNDAVPQGLLKAVKE